MDERGDSSGGVAGRVGPMVLCGAGGAILLALLGAGLKNDAVAWFVENLITTPMPALLVTGFALGVLARLAMPGIIRTARRIGFRRVLVRLPVVGEFEVGLDTRHAEAAWCLHVELATRIVTKSLYVEDAVGRIHLLGRTDAALDSLYALFGVIREEVKTAGPTPFALDGNTVPLETLAERLLNDELRPCLARWHPRREAWEGAEEDWPDAALCRIDLEATRLRALDYAVGFGRLAGVAPHTLTKYRQNFEAEAVRWQRLVREAAPGVSVGDVPALVPLELIMCEGEGI